MLSAIVRAFTDDPGCGLGQALEAVDVREYRDQGYLPEALINYLVRLGWSHGDQEIFSIDEMIRHFDIPSINQSASAFNAENLLWLDQQHIIAMAPEELGERLVPYLLAAGIDPATGPDPGLLPGVFTNAQRPSCKWPRVAIIATRALRKLTGQKQRLARLLRMLPPNTKSIWANSGSRFGWL